MTLPIYPGPDLLRGLTYSSKWSPQFYNLTSISATGAEIDTGLAEYPLHEFELTYSFLRDGPGWGTPLAGLEFKTMMGFHLALAGSRGRFLYRNPDDCRVWRNNIAIGDGAAVTFPITRTFGANGYFATEPVGAVDLAAGVNVYTGGSEIPVDPTLYTIDTSSPVANTITFDTAPADGAAIDIDMAYFYYCKLPSNMNIFEKFYSSIWKLSKVTLHSCRPNT